jgi:cobalamin biosynthetic protein CobC
MDSCRQAVASAMGTRTEAVTLVPGSEIAIRLLPQMLPARQVTVLAPSYADHAEAWRRAGAQLTATDDPLAGADTADVVVLSNPNNPDGRRFDREELVAAHERLALRGGWLIVDEAYVDLEPAAIIASLAGAPGLIVLRSAGKFFGLPGLRLGAVLGPSSIARELEQLLGVWRISGPALAVGTRAYSDLAGQQAIREKLARARRRLDSLLDAAGLSVAGGTDLFRFVNVPDAHGSWRALCERGIYTRRFDWTSVHLRIGLPASAQAETRLADALSLER